MKNIIIIAPPAAGKGTQSDLLVNKYNYSHISTGDLLREEIASKTPLGLSVETKMKNGELIGDDIVSRLLKQKLTDISGPFILDGYPRTIDQIYLLEQIIKEVGKTIDIVVYLKIDETIAMQRATGRLICPSCNRSYHKYDVSVKPKVDNLCDNCEVDLISRSDDNEESFKVRYQSYINNTKPVVDYYDGVGLLQVVDSKDTPNETFVEIEKVIMND